MQSQLLKKSFFLQNKAKTFLGVDYLTHVQFLYFLYDCVTEIIVVIIYF